MSVCSLAQRVLQEIRTHGTTAGLLDDMVSVQDFFEIMGLKETLALADTWSQRPTMSPEPQAAEEDSGDGTLSSRLCDPDR